MKKALLPLLLTFSFSAINASAIELSLKADDGFELKADYHSPAKTSKRALLMLHQCNADRKMYESLAQAMTDKGFHVLKLDFRGFGESVDEDTNIALVDSMPEEERRPYWMANMAHFPADVEVAYQALMTRVGKGAKLGIIGASCGGWQARSVAHKHPVETLIFFSAPIFNPDVPESVAEYKTSVTTLPALFISAKEDFVYERTVQAAEWNTHPDSKLLSFEGSGHGLPLFEQESDLEQQMIDWFDTHIAK